MSVRSDSKAAGSAMSIAVTALCLLLTSAAGARSLSPEHATALEEYLATVRYGAMVSTSIRGMNDYFRAPITTEAMQASMQLTSQRLGSLIENMTREMLAKPAAASPK